VLTIVNLGEAYKISRILCLLDTLKSIQIEHIWDAE
jgi:hypothetical protein